MQKRHLVFPWILALAALAVTAAQAAPLPLSLLDDRFHVEAEWRTADGQSGFGTSVRLTRETGYFWFFSPTNIEVVVKVLNACSGESSRFWVFAGGLTDTEVTLTVTDQANGERKVYRNPQGTPFAPIQDTDAFATCAAPHCGQGSFADLAASPRAEPELEGLAAVMGGTGAAPQAVYERVVADVTAIRNQDPTLSGVTFRPDFAAQTLVLELDGAAATAIAFDTYTAWDCLNRRYGMLRVSQEFPPGNMATLQFSKVLNLRRLAADYEALPGVIAARPKFPPPPPVPIPPPFLLADSYCGRIEGDVHKYFIRHEGLFLYYTSLPGMAPVRVAPAVVGEPLPPWLAEALACFDEHVDWTN